MSPTLSALGSSSPGGFYAPLDSSVERVSPTPAVQRVDDAPASLVASGTGGSNIGQDDPVGTAEAETLARFSMLLAQLRTLALESHAAESHPSATSTQALSAYAEQSQIATAA
jgi:hypothetical protein